MTPERLEKIKQVLAKRQPDLRIITDHVHKGRNLSAIVRTADAVGVTDVHCVMDEEDYTAFRGTAKGSQQWVNVRSEKNISTILDELKAQGFQFVAADVTPASVDFRKVDYTKPTALIMGAEKWGLSDEARSKVDQFITVPMVGMVESFNVSVASAIILSEAQRQREIAGFYQRCRIDTSRYQALLFEWCQPKIAAYCQRYHLDYPKLDDSGEIINASAWYQSVRAVEVETVDVC
ncbi:MAG: tRNA (guanosine(18)-2'-O)-methyltransferase TrmH [Sinobacterium sp.]|nr:tRNA (guanosine(18)-2'-O)-methyltransferase TrmH [Sinobacterium sp.]